MNHEELEERLTHVKEVKRKYEHWLLEKPNVVGVGIGLRQLQDMEEASEPVIVVNVSHTAPPLTLTLEEQVPDALEDVPVSVQVVGKLAAQPEKGLTAGEQNEHEAKSGKKRQGRRGLFDFFRRP